MTNTWSEFWWNHHICWNHDTLCITEETAFDAIVEGMRHTFEPVSLVVLSPAQIEQRIEQYTSQAGIGHEGLSQVIDESLETVVRQVSDDISIVSQADDGPIIKLLNNIFAEAIRLHASDIHIELQRPQSVVRFRIDGILTQIVTMSLAVAERVVSRVKVLARLNIAEKRIPQDGRMTVTLGSRTIDLRISTIPSVDGERLVLRLLESKANAKSIDAIGMSPAQQARLERLVLKPNGMILATGPTGSGKTTTMYSALQRIDATTKNVMTVEDPVEYRLAGISQTPINHQQNMTFATGLRAILRQDPDVVLVGEIRDGETAQIAAQASLTGHLVLSTLHANQASGCVTRLRDLGIESYIIASAVRGLIAQRLLRRVCSHCVVHAPHTQAEYDTLRAMGAGQPPATLPRAVGCAHCNQTGYSGRYGVFEVIEMTEHVQNLIQNQADESVLQQAFADQAESLLEQGIEAVYRNITTLEEVIRTLGDTQ